MIVTGHLHGGCVLAMSSAIKEGARENCHFSILAYVWLVAVYTGLLSRLGRRADGGSIPGGMDLRTIGSRLASIQSRAVCRLGLVVATRH